MSECEYCDALMAYGLLPAKEIDVPTYRTGLSSWRTQPVKMKRLIHPEIEPVSFYNGIRCRKDESQ